MAQACVDGLPRAKALGSVRRPPTPRHAEAWRSPAGTLHHERARGWGVVQPRCSVEGGRFDPHSAALRTSLNLSHTGAPQRTRPMGRAEQNHGFVIPAGFSILLADNQKSGDIIGNVFDVLA